MTGDKRDLATVRELVAETEAEVAALEALRELHDGIGRAAGHVGEATVALLSALPLSSSDPCVQGFLADAMDANAATMRELLNIQAVAAKVVSEQGDRLARLDNRYQSIRVRIEGA